MTKTETVVDGKVVKTALVDPGITTELTLSGLNIQGFTRTHIPKDLVPTFIAHLKALGLLP